MPAFTDSSHGSNVLFPEQFTLMGLQICTAGGGGGDAEQPVAVQKLPGAHAGALQTGFHLALCLCQMQLHSDAFLEGVAGKPFPETVVAGVLGVDARVDFDAPLVKAVPPVNHPDKLLTLLVGFKIEFLVGVDESVAGKGQIGLDAGLGHGLGGGVGIVVQVGHGGDAEAQALGDGEKRGGFRTAGVHFGFLLEPCLQGFRVA